jgi:hypothetical protein
MRLRSASRARARGRSRPRIAGQRKRDIELPNEDVLYFQQQRSPDRLYPPGHKLEGQSKPLHPIIIEGVGSMLIPGGRYE